MKLVNASMSLAIDLQGPRECQPAIAIDLMPAAQEFLNILHQDKYRELFQYADIRMDVRPFSNSMLVMFDRTIRIHNRQANQELHSLRFEVEAITDTSRYLGSVYFQADPSTLDSAEESDGDKSEVFAFLIKVLDEASDYVAQEKL